MRLPLSDRLWEKISPEPTSGCWLWLGRIDTQGYGQMSVSNRQTLVHRISWELKNGPVPAGLLVCHKCDVRTCVNPDHLFVGTVKDNALDMIKKGRARRYPKGDEHSQAKLSSADVYAIRATPGSLRKIAKQYGVHMHTILQIRTGKSWKHLL